MSYLRSVQAERVSRSRLTFTCRRPRASPLLTSPVVTRNFERFSRVWKRATDHTEASRKYDGRVTEPCWQFGAPAVEQFEEGRSFVLATILDVKGSSPRHVGTRFLIQQDGTIVGTIGGGLFEAQVQEFAAAALHAGTSHHAPFSFTGEGAESKEMICGGNAEVLVEFVDAGDKVREEIFKQLLAIAQNRGSGYLLTNIAIPVGGEAVGGIDYLLMDKGGSATGAFPMPILCCKYCPSSGFLSPLNSSKPQFRAPPVFLEWLKAHGTVIIFGAGHVGACVSP